MTPSLALAATITGTLLTVAPIAPQAVRDARQNAGFEIEQDPDVTADIAAITHITGRLDRWQLAGIETLGGCLHTLETIEDRLIAAHGYPVPTDEQRYQARQARNRAVEAVHAAAERAHPLTDCPKCRAWEDCPASDAALRDAVHADWVNRWNFNAA